MGTLAAQSRPGGTPMVVGDISDSWQRATDELFAWLPKLVGALVILFVGYVIARVVATAVRRGLRAVNADSALASGRAGDYKRQYAPDLQPSDVVGTIAF